MTKKMFYALLLTMSQFFTVYPKQVIFIKNLTSAPLMITNSCNLASSAKDIEKGTETSEPTPVVLTEELTPQEASRVYPIKIETEYQQCIAHRNMGMINKNCDAEKLVSYADLAKRVERSVIDTCEIQIINKVNVKQVQFRINPFTFVVTDEKRHGGLLLDQARKSNGELDVTTYIIRENGK